MVDEVVREFKLFELMGLFFCSRIYGFLKYNKAYREIRVLLKNDKKVRK